MTDDSPTLQAEEITRLRDVSRTAKVMSWAPYTRAVVFAAVRTTQGKYYGGANVEISNISLSKHAEENAILAALADGAMTTDAGPAAPRCIDAVYATAAPCGSCRQFILEFATDDCVVYVDDDGGREPERFEFSALLPRSFGPEEQLGTGGGTNPRAG